MATEPSRQLVTGSLAGYPKEIGRRLWALEDNRARTKKLLLHLAAGTLDARPAGFANSIGTLAYHIAAIEMDWLYVEVLGAEFPLTVRALLPFDVREPDGGLTPVTGQGVDAHLMRLDATRAVLLEGLRGMTVTEFRRSRRLPDYDTTPEWVLHHLLLHEAEHRGQIAELRRTAQPAGAGDGPTRR